MIFRIAKFLLVLVAGAQMLLVGLGNLLDYDANFEVIRHIASMDALSPGTPLAWRAITAPALHHLAYAVVIGAELLSAVMMIAGALRLFSALRRDAAAFNAAKGLAGAGLALALLLYYFGFMVVGGEWFQMWRAGVWNMQEAAFRFIGCLGLILIFLAQNDPELSRGD